MQEQILASLLRYVADYQCTHVSHLKSSVALSCQQYDIVLAM